MKVRDITTLLEDVAPLSLQENYDNAGLLIGSLSMHVTGVLLCVDVTEAVIEEAVSKDLNLIISHHPLIFHGLKKITGKNAVERCVVKAIQHNIAIYAAHTNIDNVIDGVNGKIADKLDLVDRTVLQPKQDEFFKLVTYVPKQDAEKVRKAIFEAGGGKIGNYDACSYNTEGLGSFRPNSSANPYVGESGTIHYEYETKIELIFPSYLQEKILNALVNTHPYEEPAYDLLPLKNTFKTIGAGIVGKLKNHVDEFTFLREIKAVFQQSCIRHTALLNKKVKKVAICGGSGSFLLSDAIKANADVFISGDFKYHEFFQAENRILIADIGHFELEQFTKEIFHEIITKKFPTFAVHISTINTNPIIYF